MRPVVGSASTAPPSDSCSARRTLAWVAQRVRKVATMARIDGTVNSASQRLSSGMCSAKTTRLAGLEIGSTKLAALAMKAQENR